MMHHLCSNNLITSHQHGFLPHKSYVTQLLKAVEEWSESLDNGNPVDVLYLDLKKAFDSVPHTRLLKKLDAYGFRGKLLDWIKSFLTGWKQQVCVNGSYSGWNDVLLGPFTFTIYINDLPSVLKNSVLLFAVPFADNTKGFTTIDHLNSSSTLQDDINSCAGRAVEWQLPFNVSKCKILHLGHFNLMFSYGNLLEEMSEEKDIGVIIDKDLKFHSHTALIVNKANRLLGFRDPQNMPE